MRLDRPDLDLRFALLLITLLVWTTTWPSITSLVRQVHVTGGEVQGVLQDRVVSFKGIPFAAPPLGALRWKPPQPVIAWAGLRKADAFALPCAQGNDDGERRTDEDCLYLNVWTGAASSKERRPVMVWIPGGGFTGGATSDLVFDGTRLAQQGVVLVSIAYRLGVLGFLAHPDLDRESGNASGDYGLQDQIAALKWVKANIAKFGGDPQRVTIFGESAGGIAVSLLTGSPAAKGLFQRAISESGGLFSAPRYSADSHDQSGPLKALAWAESIGQEFLRELGAADIDAARGIPVQAILKAAAGPGPPKFWAVLDGDVLPATNEELYRAGRFNDTPILIGTNSNEGRGNAPPAATAEMLREYARKTTCPLEAEAVLSLYPLNTDLEVKRAFEGLSRDGFLAWNTWTWARGQSHQGRGKAFLYYFDVRNPTSSDGAVHWAEVPYVFGNFDPWDGRIPLRPEDLAVSDLVRRYWINFAATGDPNGRGLPPWPAFVEGAQNAMVFDQIDAIHPCAIAQSTTTMRTDLCFDRVASHEYLQCDEPARIFTLTSTVSGYEIPSDGEVAAVRVIELNNVTPDMTLSGAGNGPEPN